MFGTLRAILEEKGRRVISVAPTVTVQEAARVMDEARTGAVVVLDGERPVGIFTERDILRRVVAVGRDPATLPVAEVMTREVAAVRPSLAIEDAMAVVTQKRVRHLPVVEEGRLVGVVSSGDLTRWVSRDRDVKIQTLVDFITGRYPA
jgi:CBS domain-containing protein